jgi:hypothetical protein
MYSLVWPCWRVNSLFALLNALRWNVGTCDVARATITSGITSFQYKVVMSFYLYDVIIRYVIWETMSHGTAVVQQSSCSNVVV